ncbi:MAG: uroporphyrinogen decarboxylase family protein [Anaerolineaceae bacterium]
MKPRERVLLTLNHQEPDRVPLALGGGPYGLVDDLYLKLLDLLELGDPVPPFRSGHNISFMDDRLLEKLGTDTRYCWTGLQPNSPVFPGPTLDSFFDSYGQIWKRALPYYYAGEGLLRNAESLEDIDRLVHWPDLSDPRWNAGLLERARTLYESEDFFVIMRMVSSHGPFQTACDFRGTENFLMDLSSNPEFAETLLDRITTSLEGLLRLVMQTAGQYFDMIELPGDDYAGNNNLIISPRMFRRFISPCIQRLIKTIKEINPKIKVMLHSDGAVASLIPDFISLGVDVLHPLEPLPASDLVDIKQKYGQQIAFLGGIDISHAMPGSTEDVWQEVAVRIRQLASGGGYILAPSNHLQADIPPQNVVALFESAHHLGKYPLSSD